MEKKYYVYIYLDPRKEGVYVFNDYRFNYEPIYVGKSCGNRHLKHLTETEEETPNVFKYRVLEKINDVGLKPEIIKVKTNLYEEEAYALETKLINLIGRRCNGSGSLTNILTNNKPPSNYIKLGGDVINEIIRLYGDGWYLKHIADKLSLNENKVKRILIENGITPKRKPPTNKLHLTVEDIKGLVDDYESGLSLRKISKKGGMSYEVVRNALKSANVKLRGYDYTKSREHINKIHEKRKIGKGKDSKCYKSLSHDEIDELKRLRFVEKLPIREILLKMGIGQSKYYEYIDS